MSKETRETTWNNVDLPPHLKKAREERERLDKEKEDRDSVEKNLKFKAAEESMNQESEATETNGKKIFL